MLHTPNKIAENASFQAFANCYLREVDAGVWHNQADWQCQTSVSLNQQECYALELQLTGVDEHLVFAASYRSLVGRHVFTRVFRKQENNWTWQPINFLAATMLLIDNIYAQDNRQGKVSEQKLELLTRTLESQQIMQDYLTQRINDDKLDELDFIASEQSLLFGHWLHPTPKSRQGIHAWQHKNYTPELKAKFQLHYFAISRQLLDQNSLIEACVEQIINQMAEVDNNDIATDKQLVPVHPLQAHWLLHQDYVLQLIDSGEIEYRGAMGKLFTPTSSVRTLYNAELAYMIKLSIPVKITNSLRRNMVHELQPGLNVGQLINNSFFSEHFPKFKMIDDPAYITVKLPNIIETGFETIIRSNPFNNTQCTDQNHNTISIAALVQDPVTPGSDSKISQQVKRLAVDNHVNTKTAALLWFESYWQCAIEPAIWLYELHGVALEAHQQNSLLTIINNCPDQYFYRDNQGFYLSSSMKDSLLQRVPALSNNLDLFYEDDMIADRVGYYMFVNQLFSVIGRLGQDGLISEKELLEFCYNKLNVINKKLKGVGANFIDSVMSKPSIPSKANLLTRVDDVDELQAEQELAVYTDIKNPFYYFHLQANKNSNQGKEVNLESA